MSPTIGCQQLPLHRAKLLLYRGKKTQWFRILAGKEHSPSPEHARVTGWIQCAYKKPITSQCPSRPAGEEGSASFWKNDPSPHSGGTHTCCTWLHSIIRPQIIDCGGLQMKLSPACLIKGKPATVWEALRLEQEKEYKVGSWEASKDSSPNKSKRTQI